MDRQYYVKHIVTNCVFFVVCMKRAAGTVKQLNYIHTIHMYVSSAGWAFHISWSHAVCNACVGVDVNHGGTNRNRCIQRIVILHAQTY